MYTSIIRSCHAVSQCNKLYCCCFHHMGTTFHRASVAVFVISVDCTRARAVVMFRQIVPLFLARFTETYDSCHAPMPQLLLLIPHGPNARVTKHNTAQ